MTSWLMVMLFMKYYNSHGSIILECQNQLHCFVKKKHGLFTMFILTWEKMPWNAWSIPRVWNTTLNYSLNLTNSSPNWTQYWNPMQYLEVYWIDLMGPHHCNSRIRREHDPTTKNQWSNSIWFQLKVSVDRIHELDICLVIWDFKKSKMWAAQSRD